MDRLISGADSPCVEEDVAEGIADKVFPRPLSFFYVSVRLYNITGELVTDGKTGNKTARSSLGEAPLASRPSRELRFDEALHLLKRLSFDLANALHGDTVFLAQLFQTKFLLT